MQCIGQATIHKPETLHTWLEQLPVGDTPYYLLHRPDRITDWESGRPDRNQLQHFASGRLFGEKGEVRWEQTQAGYALLWLWEDAHLPEGFSPLGDWEECLPQKQHLRGGGQEKRWRETRIPRELNYPMGYCNRPQVQVISYKDTATQAVRFTRFCRFVAGKEKG